MTFLLKCRAAVVAVALVISTAAYSMGAAPSDAVLQSVAERTAQASPVVTPLPLNGEDSGVRPWQVLSALAYLLILAGVGFALVKVYRGKTWSLVAGDSNALIRVIEMKRLSPSVQMAYVEVDRRRLVVVMAPNGVSVTPLQESVRER